MIARALPLLPDERLAKLAAAGSDPAFAVLYNRYSGMLFAYCRSITRNVDDGWDALQNAMVKVLVALRRSPERSAPLRPWLFCICHNESIGILRRRAAAERVADAAEWTTAAGADEQALEREQVKEVVSDVQQLPTGQRAALVMRELADLRYDEIALALETTEGNARQLVFAARAGLKDSRAGRGLPCESVRDQLSLADGRMLRRRSVRAHLRTCDRCRAYAASMRRRPVGGLSAWSPIAGYELLEPVFRAAASGPGGAAFAAKAAAVAAVVATGIGAADVATLKPERSSPVAVQAHAKRTVPEPVATAAPKTTTRAPRARTVPAVYTVPARRAVAKPRVVTSTVATTRAGRPRRSQPAPAAAQDPAAQQHEQRATPARVQANCKGTGSQQQPAGAGRGDASYRQRAQPDPPPADQGAPR
jgi:RNA polymerase sigma-70 factor (ECF subfamily)